MGRQSPEPPIAFDLRQEPGAGPHNRCDRSLEYGLPAPAVQHSRALGTTIPDDLLAHVAPLGWEHIALTGDYVWTNSNAALNFGLAD
jgi:hypothetical protein